MAGRIPMGQKELQRSKMLEMVKQGQVTLKAATMTMRVSYRQGIRLYKAYREKGEAALIHGNAGKPSNRRIADEVREAALAAYRSKYPDFGPTFAAEKLSEIEGIKISVSALRRLLIEAGEWKSKRRVKEYRSRRDRRECFGELIQFDGSHHKWFEDRGPSCCLVTMIDDATNVRLARFFQQETIEAAMTVFSLWIQSYGIPQALYCDRKNAFVLTREPTDAELLAGVTEPKSHFGRACEKLGVQVIAANSPQAKGRVERNHGVDQDRLVKEMRLAGVSTITCANAFLADYYLPKMNGKFSRPPADAADAHAPLEGVNLKDVFCYEHERTVGCDYVVRFEKRLFQILKGNKALPRPKSKVLVRVLLDGTLQILWKGAKLLVKELTNTHGQRTQDAA